MATSIKDKDREYLNNHVKIFPTYVQDYFRAKLRTLSPTTLRNYAIDFEDFFQWLIDDNIVNVEEIRRVPLSALEKLRTKQIEEDFIYYLNVQEYSKGRPVRDDQLTKTSLNRKIAALRALFYWMVNVAEDENLNPLLNRNVMAKIELSEVHYNPKDVAKKIRASILIGKEFREFRDFVYEGYGAIPKLHALSKRKHTENRERDLAIISLILATGLRIAEVASINLDDLTMKDRIVRVVRKGNKEKLIDFSLRAAEDLERYIAIRDSRYQPNKSQKALFLTNQQKPGQTMTKRAMQDLIEKYAKAFGKSLLTAHKLRHSFATRYYAKYGDLAKLQELMGHSDIKTTMIYTHVLNDELKATIDEIDE